MSIVVPNKLKSKTGRIQSVFTVDDAFPVVGQIVTLKSKMKWAESCRWLTNDGVNAIDITDTTFLNQESTTELIPLIAGSHYQRCMARNSWSTTSADAGAKNSSKWLYAKALSLEPFFDVAVSKEVIRCDGEVSNIIITTKNGFVPTTGAGSSIEVKVYAENTTTGPVATLNSTTFTNETVKGVVVYTCTIPFSLTGAANRGIYDFEVAFTSPAALTFTKRINKLVSVTPSLSDKSAPSTLFSTVNTTLAYTSYLGAVKKQFTADIYRVTGTDRYYAELVLPRGEELTCFYDAIDISVFPAGTTLILKDDPLEPVGYARRCLLKGNNDSSVSAASGTPNTSWENPLIITIDQATAYHIPFIYYSGVSFSGNVRHVVFDGRGYQNISKGIHVHKYSEEVWGQTAIWAVNGSSNVEYFEMEIYNNDFAGIFAKTDPTVDRPWYWFGSGFIFDRFCLHHCHLHDIYGEGMYLGYFSASPHTEGATTYRAHSMENTRIYRNNIEDIGYDGLQLNNARNSEICYNTLSNVGWRREQDQASGMSCSFAGKIYNNTIKGFSGVGIQINPLGELDIFNNTLSEGSEGVGTIHFLWSQDVPENIQDGDPLTVPNTSTHIYIYNNILISRASAFNARNTVQFHSVYIRDNFIVYKTVLATGQEDATIAIWEGLMEGNVALQKTIIDYTDLDETYYFGDSANSDFKVSDESTLGFQGVGTRFSHDMNGYTQMIPGYFPIGPFQGTTRNEALVNGEATLNGLSINSGAPTTSTPNVSVTFDTLGTPAFYRLAESLVAIEAAPWIAWTGSTVSYTIASGTPGVKTIYGQVQKSSIDSVIDSDTITIAYAKTVVGFGVGTPGDNTTLVDGTETLNIICYDAYEGRANVALVDVDGNASATFVTKPSEYPAAPVGATITDMIACYQPTFAVPESGVYPDAAIGLHWGPRTSNITDNWAIVCFKDLVPGTYTVRILEGTSNAYTLMDYSLQNYVVNNMGITPVITSVNNNTEMTEITDVTVDVDGILSIYFFNDGNKYYQPGVNLVEFIRTA